MLLKPPLFFLLLKSMQLLLLLKTSPSSGEATDQVPKESQELEAPLTQQDVPHQTEETIEKVPAPFVPSMGAWSKRLVLNLSPPSTPAEPSTPRSYDPQLVQSQIDNFWPSLEEGTNLKQKKCLVKGAPLSLNLQPWLPPELKEDGSLRFPWAARMNPATRNLYRASKPTFRLDGTPEIIIPTKVLQLGPENVGEYVIGQFHRCSVPSGGLMHAVVNRLWGRSCKIVSRKLGESSYLFHVPHKETRHWIIQRTVWHVDDCLMFVAPWNQVGTLKIPEISTVPAWVTLKNIPTSCYSRLGISHIASGLGEPMLTHKPRLDPFNIGEAKILVEIELDKNFPKQIALDDKLGNIFLVDVIYSWIPSTCERCGSLGHKAKRCLLKEDKRIQLMKEARIEDVEIPVVAIDSLMEINVPQQKVSDSSKFDDTIVLPQEVQHSSSVHVPHQSPSQLERTETSSLSLQVSPSPFKESSTVLAPSSLDAKFTPCPKLAGSSPARTTPHVMEDVPSNIIMNEGIVLSGNDPSNMTPFKSESIQQDVNMENDFHINEEMDDYGSVSRGGRIIKPAQKYQGNEWFTVRGKGKRGRRGRGS
ncbi:hypothetical protein Bca52824_086941 [Brassica carinata]|uniref:CCHC-type domain-containing protein n=1 Tax=Brassica carinata TaxID=52824 RepID=A0A8X7PB69_BRACI|nr:hypothetical protein Bca52824_086941 [Brassica carinata]